MAYSSRVWGERVVEEDDIIVRSHDEVREYIWR